MFSIENEGENLFFWKSTFSSVNVFFVFSMQIKREDLYSGSLGEIFVFVLYQLKNHLFFEIFIQSNFVPFIPNFLILPHLG